MSARAISLTRELWLLLRALQGQRHLADHAFDLPEAHGPAREVLSALSATIAIIEARLLMLDRVVRGEVDPALLWSSFNDAGPHWHDAEGEDVHLQLWDATVAVRRARDELKRAKARRAHEEAKPPADEDGES